MKKKLGPLTRGQWIAVAAASILLYYLYKKYQANQAAATGSVATDTASTPANTTGPTSAGGGGSTGAPDLSTLFTDPATGLNYFDELNAHLNTLQSTVPNSTSTPTAPVSPAPVFNITLPTLTPTNPAPGVPVAPSSGTVQSTPAGLTLAQIEKIPIAQQIVMFKNGTINQLGPNAQKVFNAGGTAAPKTYNTTRIF